MKQLPDLCRRNLQEVGYAICYREGIDDKIKTCATYTLLVSAQNGILEMNRGGINTSKYFVRKFFYYFEPLENEKES